MRERKSVFVTVCVCVCVYVCARYQEYYLINGKFLVRVCQFVHTNSVCL